MIVTSEYVSEYCIWLVLRSGLQQLTDAGQLPFSIIDLSTTGVVVSCTYIRFLSVTIQGRIQGGVVGFGRTPPPETEML